MTVIHAVLATGNAHKVPEIAEILGPAFVLDAVDPDVEETGATFEENALLKARAVAVRTGRLALADDSGIEVDALGGTPGVHSARFLGPSATDGERNARILSLLEGIPGERRTARYRAAVAIARPNGTVRVFEGICEGRVAAAPRGTAGFGYDPIFVLEGAEQTIAEIPIEVKNRISHRARALRAAEPYLREVLGLGEQDRRARDAK